MLRRVVNIRIQFSLAHFGLFSTDMTPRGQNSPAREGALVDDAEGIAQEIDFLEQGLEHYQGRGFPHGRLRTVIDEIHKIPAIDTQCKLFRKLLDNVFPYLLPFHTPMHEVADNVRGYISDANHGALAASDRPGW